jgi:uncharacterized protein involved in exopolysaccharide biosynthesis
MKANWRVLAGFILFLAGILLSGAGFYMLLQPDQYQAVTTISVDEQPIDLEGDYSYNPYFILTEIEIMRSHEVLTKVATSLNLKEVWSKKYNHGQRLSDSEIEQRIKSELDINQVRHTKWFQIKVLDDDPGEASALANSIAGHYREYRDEEYRFLRQHGIESLKAQLQDSEKKIQTAQQEMEKQQNDLKISDPTTASNKPAAAPYFEARRTVENLRRNQELLKTKIAQFESADSRPRPAMATIISPATRPIHPVRPNRYLATAITVFGFLLVIGGVVCLNN